MDGPRWPCRPTDIVCPRYLSSVSPDPEENLAIQKATRGNFDDSPGVLRRPNLNHSMDEIRLPETVYPSSSLILLLKIKWTAPTQLLSLGNVGLRRWRDANGRGPLNSSPTTTWCLFNSNNEISNIPTAIHESTLFVMQAVPPRKGHLDWVRKTLTIVTYFFMQSWTAEELVAGLQLQLEDSRKATPTEFVEHFEHFGGYTRDACGEASELDSHLEKIVKIAQTLEPKCLAYSLTPDSMADPMTDGHVPIFPFVDDQLKHELVTVLPAYDSNWCECNFKLVTNYILDTILDSVTTKLAMSRATLVTRLFGGKR
ncbi:hypothetical protein GYMLUDRAFT_55913 [Collybiopsis luxurians FD-317 M1]|nr:hypothetical protein GYMLUDRAFT_55913 [Collybiopsis luxurians FD-317 M1]